MRKLILAGVILAQFPFYHPGPPVIDYRGDGAGSVAIHNQTERQLYDKIERLQNGDYNELSIPPSYGDTDFPRPRFRLHVDPFSEE